MKKCLRLFRRRREGRGLNHTEALFSTVGAVCKNSLIAISGGYRALFDFLSKM
jgi:hypothetical protein